MPCGQRHPPGPAIRRPQARPLCVSHGWNSLSSGCDPGRCGRSRIPSRLAPRGVLVGQEPVDPYCPEMISPPEIDPIACHVERLMSWDNKMHGPVGLENVYTSWVPASRGGGEFVHAAAGARQVEIGPVIRRGTEPGGRVEHVGTGAVRRRMGVKLTHARHVDPVHPASVVRGTRPVGVPSGTPRKSSCCSSRCRW